VHGDSSEQQFANSTTEGAWPASSAASKVVRPAARTVAACGSSPKSSTDPHRQEPVGSWVSTAEDLARGSNQDACGISLVMAAVEA
jgi:hypothetical protein